MINSWPTSNKSVRPHCVCTKDSKMLMLMPLLLRSMSSPRNLFALVKKSRVGSTGLLYQSFTTSFPQLSLRSSFPYKASLTTLSVKKMPAALSL